MLFFRYFYYSVNVIIQLMLFFHCCYYSVNVIIQLIIWLMLSIFLWSKVITSSGTYCTIINKFLSNYKNHKFTNSQFLTHYFADKKTFQMVKVISFSVVQSDHFNRHLLYYLKQISKYLLKPQIFQQPFFLTHNLNKNNKKVLKVSISFRW
jgi:hypothetical protein